MSIVRRTQIYLEDGQHQQLSARARSTGRTTSDLIREAIDQYLRGPEDREARLERLRDALRATAGAAPELPSGEEFVTELRRADSRRHEAIGHRWRS